MEKHDIRVKCLTLAVELVRGKTLGITNVLDYAKAMEHYVTSDSPDKVDTPEQQVAGSALKTDKRKK